MKTATNPFSKSSNLEWEIEQKFFTSDVGAATSKNSRSKDMDCDVHSDSGTNKERMGYLLGAAELLLKPC